MQNQTLFQTRTVDSIIIFTDGATVGHNGSLGTVKEVGLGMYVPSMRYGAGKKVPGISNNEAEFKALIWAMEWAVAQRITSVRFMLDSRIVVNRANGRRPKKLKWKNPRMDAFQDRVLSIARAFEFVSFNWVPREQNQQADYYSKRACYE